MKHNSPITLTLAAMIVLSAVSQQNLEAGERRKKLPDCLYCKRPVFSYYKFKTYENHKPVYDWITSGHSKCGPATAVVKAATATEQKEKASHKKAKAETTVYARHGEHQAYGGGSGYVAGYGGGYGGGVYGNPIYSEYRYGGANRYDRYSYGYGTGYGTGTVTRRTTVIRSTPARGIFGGFSGTSNRTYITRTRTTSRGSFGGIWRGGNFGRSGICYY